VIAYPNSLSATNYFSGCNYTGFIRIVGDDTRSHSTYHVEKFQKENCYTRLRNLKKADRIAVVQCWNKEDFWWWVCMRYPNFYRSVFHLSVTKHDKYMNQRVIPKTPFCQKRRNRLHAKRR